jgi:hypothetical protein
MRRENALHDHLHVLAADVRLREELLLPDPLEELLLVGVLGLGAQGRRGLGRRLELLLNDGKESCLQVRETDLCDRRGKERELEWSEERGGG